MKKCAVITGGASGIGKAIAKALVEEGHSVIIADLNVESGQVVANELGANFIKTDLSQQASCKALIDDVLVQYGRIDILVNNGGYQHVSPIDKFSEEIWNEMLHILLTAPFLLTRYVWPSMKENNWGRIINIASVHSEVASPHKVAYISAKHGLIGLTRTAALEGGEFGITVNAISPAYVRTPLVENQVSAQAKLHDISEDEVIDTIMLAPAAVKRLIEPDEVANLVLLMTSEQGNAITGANWKIDCGWTAK